VTQKFLVTGAKGLVGTNLCRILRAEGYEVVPLDLPGADITNEPRMSESVRKEKPHWVVNLAAWTFVDLCEQDPDAAIHLNAFGARVVAHAARQCGASLLQVSTDYVFDGAKSTPYNEEDEPRPLSAYGASKLEGEKEVSREMAVESLLIVRGQSLYGAGRKSFPDAIRHQLAGPDPVKVVTDQVVSPTWARDFAEGLHLLMKKNACGVYHLSASESCSWFDFARAVAEEWGLDPSRILPTTAASIARPARRPHNSVFDLTKYERLTGVPPRHWREQLHGYKLSTEAGE